MFQVDLQMAKCCLLDLPANLFANANPFSKQIGVFLGPGKILEQSKMLMECPCGTSMDFYPHALASKVYMFRVWQDKTECNDLFSGVQKASCCNLGDRQSVTNPNISFFISTCNALKHTLLLL